MYQCKLGLITAAVLLGLLVSAGVAEPVWHSYDATIRTVGDGLIRGDIIDANNNINAELKFYMSSDALGVAEAYSIALGGNGVYSTVPSDANLHAETWQDGLDLIVDFAGGYWRVPCGNGTFATDIRNTNSDWFTPFIAKEILTGDLVFHPADQDTVAFQNRLGVIAFIAPQDGEYEITNFGGRALQTQIQSPDTATQSVHIIDDRTGLQVKDSIAVGGIIGGNRDITWKLSPNTTTMNLLAGEEIHFAVHCTDTFVAAGASEEFYWDATSVAFDITLVPEPSTFLLSTIGFLGVGLVAWRRRKRA